MKIEKTKIIPAKQYKTFDYFCDLCKEEMCDEEETRDGYDIEKHRVYYASGSCYPDGGYEEGEEFHLCKDCIKTKIFPLIKETLKINSTVYERDW